MQTKYIKKVYISIMSIVLLMLTAVTTTFAWVGFLDTTFFEQFEVNLEASSLGEYGLQISLTGEENTFTNSIDQIELKRVILKNAGFEKVDLMSDDDIKNTNFSIDQCSVPRSGNALGNFIDINGKTTNKIIRFDLYLASEKSADFKEEDESTYYMDAFLDNGIFDGVNETKKLMNDFHYPTKDGFIEYPKTYMYDYFNSGIYEMNYPSFISDKLISNPEVSGNITVNSSSACRLALEIREPVKLYDTTSYATVKKTIIYQGGTQYPTYNPSTGEYSFGGILPDDYNVAVYDYNNKIMYGYDPKTVPEWALQRGDLEFDDDGVTNRIIDSNDSKVGIDKMIKITISFWFEGWDADCFSIINQKPVSLNLSFSNYHY